jgi:hypothetical protein
MAHYMMDIETLGTKPGCQILTLAVVRFDPYTNTTDTIYERFYKRIDLEDSKKYNFKVDPATLKWWNDQSEEVRKEAFENQPREDLKSVLLELNSFLTTTSKKQTLYMWSHGKEFDIPIVEYAMTELRVPILWRFWDTRDTRTVYAIADVDLKTIKTPEGFKEHNALGDVLKQIVGVKRSFQKLK